MSLYGGLKDLNNKLNNFGDEIKVMYTCGRESSGKCSSGMDRLKGILFLLLLIVLFYNIFYKLSLGGVLKGFIIDRDILKMFIGLLILGHLKNFTKSLIQNIILPLLYPILPYIECNINICLGPFNIKVGNFITDMVIFILNLLWIYSLTRVF